MSLKLRLEEIILCMLEITSFRAGYNSTNFMAIPLTLRLVRRAALPPKSSIFYFARSFKHLLLCVRITVGAIHVENPPQAGIAPTGLVPLRPLLYVTPIYPLAA